MAIRLPQQVEQRLIASIRRYFAEQLELDAGELKARLLLDFVLREIGPSIHNRAVADARAAIQDRVADVEDALYEPEQVYWKR